MAINSWGELICNTNIKIGIADAQSGIYKLIFKNLSSFAAKTQINLNDKFLNTSVPILDNTEYSFSVTADPNSSGHEPFSFQINKIASEVLISEVDQQFTIAYNENIQWYLNEVLMEGETSPSITPQVSGIYSVTVNYQGCELSGSKEFIFTGIEDEFPKDIHVYPNPVTNQLFITTDRLSIESITLINMIGQSLGEIQLSSERGHQVGMFEMSLYTKGIYIIKIVENKNIHLKRIIMQ